MYSGDRKSTRLNSSHTVIYTLSLHDALPISHALVDRVLKGGESARDAYLTFLSSGSSRYPIDVLGRSEEHTSELQSHSDLHSFPTRRSSDLPCFGRSRFEGWRECSRCLPDFPLIGIEPLSDRCTR